jgi:hypothetical protein
MSFNFRFCAFFAVVLSGLVSFRAMALPPDVPVTVRVRTVAGTPIRGAYVALVPVWRPWSRPLQEAIAEKGVSVLRVPAGNYHLIAGATGFAISTSGPMPVAATSAKELAVELRALTPVTGNVSDEQGNPIAGVVVAGVNAAIAPPLGTLSELGVRHVGLQWSAQTDKEGAWTLGLPEGTIPFAIDLNATVSSPAFCSVTGPMGTVDAFKATVGQPMDVNVPAATGTLRIPDWGARKSPEVFWLVAPDGRVISLSAVATKIGRFASPLIIPALAAGRWKVVRIESLPQWMALGSGLAGSLHSFAEVALNAGATETIQLYDIQARRAGLTGGRG